MLGGRERLKAVGELFLSRSRAKYWGDILSEMLFKKDHSGFLFHAKQLQPEIGGLGTEDTERQPLLSETPASKDKGPKSQRPSRVLHVGFRKSRQSSR